MNFQVIRDKLNSGSVDFSLAEIDTTVLTACTIESVDRISAQDVLDVFKRVFSNPAKLVEWFESSNQFHTKYFMLQTMEQIVKTKWKIMNSSDQDGIKNFIVQIIINLGSEENQNQNDLTILQKSSVVLIEIVKSEWPTSWPTFIPDLIVACNENRSLCRLTMRIFKMLCEEIFEFSKGRIVQSKVKHLKEIMINEFVQIFRLCEFVMTNFSNDIPLISETLQTLKGFVYWIPPSFLFDSGVLNYIMDNHLLNPNFTIGAVSIISEISKLDYEAYIPSTVEIFKQFVEHLSKIFTTPDDVKTMFDSGNDSINMFILKVAECFTNFFCCHFDAILTLHSTDDFVFSEHMRFAFEIMFVISNLPDFDGFKICMDFFHWFTSRCLKPDDDHVSSQIPNKILCLNFTTKNMTKLSKILSQIHNCIILNMPPPNETVIVENDMGDAVRENMEDTETIHLHNICKSTLINLTSINIEDSKRIFEDSMKQMMPPGDGFSIRRVNSLCWAIGAINGSYPVSVERVFLIHIIQKLLNLCEEKTGKNNKAIIAGNIMHVVMKYPRFLNNYYKFMCTVIRKLFEFMHEEHEGVIDMAVDTFEYICKECKENLASYQLDEPNNMIDTIVDDLGSIVDVLEPSQMKRFFRAIGYPICEIFNRKDKYRIIEKAIEYICTNWNFLADSLVLNIRTIHYIDGTPPAIFQENVLTILSTESENIHFVANIISILESFFKTTGSATEEHSDQFFQQLIGLYSLISEKIHLITSVIGQATPKFAVIKKLRTVNHEILNLIKTCVNNCGMANLNDIIINKYLQVASNSILPQYQSSFENVRDFEVIQLVTVFIENMKNFSINYLPIMCNFIFNCTLDMINKDVSIYQEHRKCFFEFMLAIVINCFEALANFADNDLKVFVETVIWALKHPSNEISSIGMVILQNLIVKFAEFNNQHLQYTQTFFRKYYMDMLTRIVEIITDVSLGSVAYELSSILSSMIAVLEHGIFLFNLSDDNGMSVNNGMSIMGNNPAEFTKPNINFVNGFIKNFLSKMFTHLSSLQITVFVDGLFAFYDDLNKITDHIRDFILQIKEFRGQDVSDLFLEERLHEIQNMYANKNTNPLSALRATRLFDETDI